jgi:hypothetical protein
MSAYWIDRLNESEKKVDKLRARVAELEAANAQLFEHGKSLFEQKQALEAPIARPLAEYHEDQGFVTWWEFPVREPAWIGRPDDSDWPGYHTHWSPHPPIPIEAAIKAGE